MWTIQQAEKEDLEYELKETKTQLSNVIVSSIKGFISFGATPDQIAAQLNIPVAEVESEIKGLD